ncbi:hypothetical protein [Micromonospora sp. WMMA2032]|uniref:hypothetical protein n=1 Tax=Micromonospora sp. WMMA2032 TaxID=2039870 RepID=UPI0020A57897|nr:hypothetical protein [Micromonospora sp. WMMA2032]
MAAAGGADRVEGYCRELVPSAAGKPPKPKPTPESKSKSKPPGPPDDEDDDQD